jgi:hypothetical protein
MLDINSQEVKMSNISIKRQIQCMRDEIDRSKRIFPLLVADGKMDEDFAELKIITLQAVLQTLTQLNGLVSKGSSAQMESQYERD